MGWQTYHSFAARGAFSEWSVAREVFASRRGRVELSGVLGLNHGYIADGHRGPNHVALGLTVVREINRRWKFEAILTRSWALARDPSRPGDSLLLNLLNGECYLSRSF